MSSVRHTHFEIMNGHHRHVLPVSTQNKVTFLSQEELIEYFGYESLPKGHLIRLLHPLTY